MAKPKLMPKLSTPPKPTPEAQGKMAGRGGTWTLTFGRISFPVQLYTAAREEKVSFNQLHAHKHVDGEATEEYCGSRIKQKKVCPACDIEVEGDDILKGYAVDEKAGVYVTVTEDELNAQKSYATDVMEIAEFVPVSQIPPLYFESSFYLCPDAKLPQILKTYAVLRSGMVAEGKAAIARITKNQKEQLIFLVPADDDCGMYAFLAFMSDEIRTVNFPKLPDVQPGELALARKLIGAMSDDFQPQKYSDTYRANVLALIEAKKSGAPILPMLQKKLPAHVIDLEAALAESLADANDRKRKKAS
jgi:DNA end-binding protein Ku